MISPGWLLGRTCQGPRTKRILKTVIEEEINKFQEVKFIQSGNNLCYSGGNNLGIKYALEQKADYIFILNPDTQLDKSCISELVKILEEQKNSPGEFPYHSQLVQLGQYALVLGIDGVAWHHLVLLVRQRRLESIVSKYNVSGGGLSLERTKSTFLIRG